MDNNELLAQVIAAMNEQTEMLVKMMDEKIEQRISAAESRINMKLEHEISKKIESLFDGYKLVHEQQWELARENERLRSRIEDIEVRLSALENRSA